VRNGAIGNSILNSRLSKKSLGVIARSPACPHFVVACHSQPSVGGQAISSKRNGVQIGRVECGWCGKRSVPLPLKGRRVHRNEEAGFAEISEIAKTPRTRALHEIPFDVMPSSLCRRTNCETTIHFSACALAPCRFSLCRRDVPGL
jgi:hypothetical protein